MSRTPRNRFPSEKPAAGRSLLLRACLTLSILAGNWLSASESAEPLERESASMILAVGAPGEPVYEERFQTWATLWREAAAQAGVEFAEVGLTPNAADADRDTLKRLLSDWNRESEEPLWLVLLGHGTFDGRQARFNLRGDDLSAEDLAGCLESYRRPLVIVDCSSSSAPFLKALSHTNRVIITATSSGYEQNFAYLGRFLAEALQAPEADLDQDDQTSLLEAFVFAAHEVAQFYETDGRLLTEHALIDDNGDGLGTPVDWYQGLRVTRKATEGKVPDGLRAHQILLIPSAAERALPAAFRQQRDRLEQELAELRTRKESLDEQTYYTQLETILLKLARLYQSLDSQ